MFEQMMHSDATLVIFGVSAVLLMVLVLVVVRMLAHRETREK